VGIEFDRQMSGQPGVGSGAAGGPSAWPHHSRRCRTHFYQYWNRLLRTVFKSQHRGHWGHHTFDRERNRPNHSDATPV
jgi:hypothetical protein